MFELTSGSERANVQLMADGDDELQYILVEGQGGG